MLDCPRKIKLYGDLADFVGVKEIESEVHTIAGAVKCLIGNYPQVENYMMDKYYKVIVNEKPRTLEELHFPTGQYDIKIVPVISGQGRGLGSILFGAALIFGGFITNFIYKNYKNRKLIKANWNTIILHALYCILLIITLII